jgi:hypothetical protein
VNKKSRSSSKAKPLTAKPAVKQCRTLGTVVVWPRGVEHRYGIKPVTRWRWERDKKLPPRDVFVNGVPIGWKPATLEASERGEHAA